MIDLKKLTDQELDKLTLSAIHEIRIRSWNRGWDKGVEFINNKAKEVECQDKENFYIRET